MKALRAIVPLTAIGWCVAACASPLRVAALDDAERVRASESAREGAALAPDVYARAEQERVLARQAHASGDDVQATLRAERSIAAYGHALVLARARRASADLADAQRARDKAMEEQAKIESSQAQLEQQAAELELHAQTARERLLPAASRAADPERAAARLTAARSLAVEARLLCGAARLVAPSGAGVDAASATASALSEKLDRPSSSPAIDEAARARAQCLDSLTRARRASGASDASADAILAALSADGGWDPSRDERGVVIALRGIYQGAQLTEEGASRLKELGRFAAAHPRCAVQVVVHDALALPPKDRTDADRAAAAVQALVSGGASEASMGTELAGACEPIVDPHDAQQRGRNERLEVVFVDH